MSQKPLRTHIEATHAYVEHSVGGEIVSIWIEHAGLVGSVLTMTPAQAYELAIELICPPDPDGGVPLEDKEAA